ncbi:filamentous hemagglutinin N-terminal domain-containing protein [Burkholderia sp. Se-20378]|uniref:two-partner secretion domain-containing protein n=1 Tax=Burkholderia sp. Se-20378 TaxID=2703899 RepID=UPI00197EEF02|nr:filamentous hemagglutinin N-terminal domain-containing protein [Burkholderia sp. Se-20378]MBN3768765.1 filamentous hemagglutinin N-terminal domain-containing protein [Burkholderia sp. Se-20378]
MNKTYALVWNGAQRCWSAVGETARRRGKASGGKRAAITAVSLLGFTALPAFALPSGEAILSGKADILRTEDGRTMNINQHTDKLITNWQDFSVGGGERVSFHQPDSQSLALNRVIGTNGSRIDGQISANGRVFLVNPNGVLFGSGAQVNVGGLVASTQNLSDADFLAGNYRFSGSSTQSVTNDGTITAADGGSVALLGARVANNGVIQAKMGRIALGAGNAFTVNFDGSGLLNLQVNGGAVDAQASNGGLLKADGGEVLMTARAAGNLLDAVVNHTGTIEARGLNARGGKITLDGGTVKVGGKLDASAADAGAPTGSILTRGERVDVANDVQVDTRAGHTAGTWTIEAANASVGDTAGASNARGFNNNSNITGNEGVGHGGGGSSTSNASIAADTLSRNLGTTNVALTNTKHDLTVGGPVSWSSDNTLTLTSATGNVNLRKSLSASGNDARLLVNAANRIDIDDAVTLTGRNAHLELNSKAGHALSKQAVVTLSGRNASYRSNGDDYTVLHTLDDLRNVDANLGGRYILGNAIDGNHASFRSIGGTRFFNGKFDGLGNTISRLNITNPGFNAVGLFAANTGWIGNLRLDSLVANTTGARYAAALGGLVGMNVGGQIRNVDATNITVNGNGSASGIVGGLVGRNLRGTIENVRFAGKVSGRTDSLSVGGLVGRNDDGTLRNVSSNATVSAGIGGYVGGLVGYNSGTIENATASGNVTAEKYATVGGLVGTNAAGGVIRNVSTDNTLVASESFIGGIAGENEKGGLIENASSSATIGGRDSKGGLVAINRGTLRASHSRVTLSGSPTDFGGLVWFNEGVIESSSASGPAANYPAVKVNIGKVDDKTAMLSVK